MKKILVGFMVFLLIVPLPISHLPLLKVTANETVLEGNDKIAEDEKEKNGVEAEHAEKEAKEEALPVGDNDTSKNDTENDVNEQNGIEEKPTDEKTKETKKKNSESKLQHSDNVPTLSSGDFQYSDNGDGTATITGYIGSNTDIEIPDTLDGLRVTKISDDLSGLGVFRGITSVTFPETLEYIGYNAFPRNRLTSVIIPDSVTIIGNRAFERNQLEEITIGNSVTSIGDDAFSENRLTSVTIPNNVTMIGSRSFENNYLKEVTIGNSVTRIRSFAFQGNQLTTITIPDSVVSIELLAFRWNQLEEVTIQNNSATIGQEVFVENQSDPVNLTLIGHSGSTTEAYANGNGHTFISGEGSATFSPNGSSVWAQSHSTEVKVSGYAEDKGELLQYAWSASIDTPTSGWSNLSNGVILIAPIKSGEYYLHVQGMNLFKETFNHRSEAFKVDNTTPTMPTINVPTTWQNSDVSVEIEHGEEEHSGVDKTEYRIDNGSWTTYSDPITISTSGETNIDAKTFDNVGNISSTASVTVKIDKEQPSLQITPNTTETTHDDVELTVKGSDAVSGVKRIQDPDSNWHDEDQIRYTVKDNGTYAFTVEDFAGNQTIESIEINNIDKTISFEIPTISGLEDITLSSGPTTHTIDVLSIIVKDWRDGTNDWRLDVSASQLKMANGDYELPAGTITLKPLSEIHRVEGTGNVPAISMTDKTELDNGVVTIAETNNSRGEFDFIFPEAALEFLIDPTTIKVNNPNGTTYETKITWKLVTGP